MITFENGAITKENYRPKSKEKIPTEEEKTVYFDYMNTLKGANIDELSGKEREKVEDEIRKKIAEKYRKSIDDIEKIFNKVSTYMM